MNKILVWAGWLLATMPTWAVAQYTGGSHDGYDMSETVISVLPHQFIAPTSRASSSLLRHYTIRPTQRELILPHPVELEQVRLYQANGQLIWEYKPDAQPVRAITLPATLPVGIYYLSVNSTTALFATYRLQVVAAL